MTMLTASYQSLLQQGWQGVFPQQRSERRAIEHAMALPGVVGPRTIAATICALGRQHQDWSADYKMFSRSPWQADALFNPAVAEYLKRYPQGPIAVAIDETKLAKTGKKIASASWQRDPMSPPFHVNFIWGLRFLQASLLFPHYREGDLSARAIPVRFTQAPSVKKPGQRSTEEEKKHYRQLVKQNNLSTQTLQVIAGLRSCLDGMGGVDRPLALAMDGSFCNRTLFRNPLDRVDLIARCRKDARLCWPAAAGSRRKYDPQRFTPEQKHKDKKVGWKKARVYFGGDWRRIKYKQLNGVLWKRGGGTRRLRLIVIAPQPYKLSTHSRVNYRQPAYLLCTDCASSAKALVQIYFDRWQIEVNHRDEKTILGVGQAQVRSAKSVPRHPAFAVAIYSMLLLSALRQFGPERTAAYAPLPKWRKNGKRPSLQDLITLLCKEHNETSDSSLLHQKEQESITMCARN
jgi:hypothetical protein